MMAVAGASMVCSTLPRFKCGLRRSLAACETTKTNRAGLVLLVVGAQRIRSYTAINICGVTGSGRHLRWVRALRKMMSSASSFTAWPTGRSLLQHARIRAQIASKAVCRDGQSASNRLDSFDGGNLGDVMAQHVLDAVTQRDRRGGTTGTGALEMQKHGT